MAENFKFPFGSNQPYYSRREPESQASSQALGIAKLFGVGAAAFGTGFLPYGQGNVFDVYFKAAKSLGHLTPLGLFASLRVPEAISPFTSTHFKSGGLSNVLFDKKYLGSGETLQYLNRLTGIDETTLRDYGIGAGADISFEPVVGTRGAFGQGRLVSTHQGTTQVLSDNIMLIERSHTIGEPFSPRTNINQFAEGMASAVADRVKNVRNVFTASESGSVVGAHRWLPVHSITGSTSSLSDFWKRVTYFRGASAFAAQRPINALETMTDNIPIFGESLQPLLKRIGWPRKTTATGSYLGLTGFAVKIAAAGMAVSQYNWWMRYQSEDSIAKKEFGYATSSAAVGFAASWIGRSVKKGLLSERLFSINSKAFAIAGIAAFIGQNIAPGFDKGVYAGASNTLTSLSLLKAHAGQITGMSSYRRTLEETFPDISSTGMGVIVGGLGYASAQLLQEGEGRYTRFAKHLKYDLGPSGIRGMSLDKVYEAWEKTSYNMPVGKNLNDFKAEVEAGTTKRPTLPFGIENQEFEEQMMSEAFYSAKHPTTPKSSIPEHVGKFSTLSMGDKAQKILEHISQNKFARWRGAGMGAMLFAAGFLGHHVVTSGLGLGTLETPEQLRRQASGDEWVPVRKSRWWGGGGTPWEGGKVSHFRPSVNAMITSDAESKTLWGEDTERYSPIARWFLKNFTYELEMRHYYDRPYPMSSPAFADVPVIGDLLGATIGSLIKPPRKMHSEEWSKVSPYTGDPLYLTVPKQLDSNPSSELGGAGIGVPLSPYSAEFVLSQQQYKMRELQGLLGFAKNVLQEMATGSETFVPNVPVLASSGQMSSATDRYWDMELGGLAGTTELVRRFLPKDRLETRNRYNPIVNEMPSWLPSEFQRGDQYASLSTGWARLPGPGFAALYPELKGVDAENYPLWYRHMILGSIAPYSDEFRENKMKLYGMRKVGLLSEDIGDMIDRVDQQVIEQRQRRNFYQEGASNLDDPDIQRAARGAYFGLIDATRRFFAPVEYLSPFRPFQKFLPPGTAIDDYQNNFIYGSEIAMWKPSSFVKEYTGPSFLAVLRNLGYDLVPPDVQQKRTIDEYFDKLTYYKYMTLSMQAKEQGQSNLAYQYEKYAHKTVYGVNPYGHPLSIYGALPEAEKSHYDAFAATTDPRERERLMQLLPENQKKLFAAIWAKRDGISDKYKTNEGMTNEYQGDYMSSGMSRQVKYADYARLRELEKYFAANPPPREDWVGWHGSADLNDVKMQYVKKEGWDIHDFNMWENQEMSLARKPYLEGSEQEIQIDRTAGLKSQITQLLGRLNPNPSLYSYQLANRNEHAFIPSSSVTYIRDDREQEIAIKFAESNER